MAKYYLSGKAETHKLSIYLPALLTIATILLMPVLSYSWKLQETLISKTWVTQLIIISLHIIIFILAAISLSIAKSKSLFILSLGYVLILGADLILDFGIFSQTIGNSSLFETSWFAGELLVLYSFVTFKRNREYKKSPREWILCLDTIVAKSTFWCFVVFMALYLIFLSITCIVYPKTFPNHENFIRILTTIMIITTIFIVILSRTISRKVYAIGIEEQNYKFSRK